MSLDADRIYHKLLSAGEDWADKRAAALVLEETKKPLLAKLMNESKATSVAAKEMEALADDRYQEHIKSMVEAGRNRDRADVLYESLKALMELRRSQESTRRAEAAIR